MFIREKTINGQKYGYLVENNWNKGRIKQQVKEYIGKIIEEGETKTANGHQVVDEESENQKLRSGTQDTGHETWSIVREILRQHLEEKGYISDARHQAPGEGLQFTKEKTIINLETGEVIHKGKPAVIKINQGHITKHTILEVRSKTKRKNDNEDYDDERMSIQEFAKAIIHIGINTTQEMIIQMYEKQETRDEKREKKEFYY